MSLPTTNLSLWRVACEIGEVSNGKLVTNLSALCSSTKINKWAKYKPVRYNFTSERPTKWYAGKDGCYGLNIPGYSSISALISDLRNGITFWEYLPPTGGSESPYRLGDFAGYNGNAQQPVYCNDLPNIVYKDVNSNIGMALDINLTDSDNVQLSDLTGKYPLADYYPAVICVRSDLTSGNFITGTQTLSQGQGEGMEVPISQLTSGYDYDFVICLSSISQTTYGPNSTVATFVPAPCYNVIQRVSIKSGGLGVFVSGSWTNNKSTYTISITNKVASSGAKMTSIRLQIVYLDFNVSGDSMEVGETSIGLADITAPYNQEYQVTGTISNSLPDFNTRGGKAILTYTYNGIVNTVVGEFEQNV